MSTFFREITEAVPSLFRGIFLERNSVANPNISVLSKGKQKILRNSACRIWHSLQPAWWRTNGAGICMWFTVLAVPKKATQLSSESAFLKKCSPVTGLIIQSSNYVCPNSLVFLILSGTTRMLIYLGILRTFPISWHAELWLIPCWLQVLYVSIKKNHRNSISSEFLTQSSTIVTDYFALLQIFQINKMAWVGSREKFVFL